MDCAIYLLVRSQLNLQRSQSLALLRIYSHSDPTPYVAEMHLQLRLSALVDHKQELDIKVNCSHNIHSLFCK